MRCPCDACVLLGWSSRHLYQGLLLALAHQRDAAQQHASPFALCLGSQRPLLHVLRLRLEGRG